MDNLGFSLTKEEKRKLLNLVRQSIGIFINSGGTYSPDKGDFPGRLSEKLGAFVTLHLGVHLRGCIGIFTSDKPLYQTVSGMALAAAFDDPRFPPLSKAELDKVDIEISVLSPLKKIDSIDQFEIGVHGIYMTKGRRSGPFLPQVAHETGWTKEEFLGHCSRDKAGLGWDGWKEADLYIYSALVFGEKE